jgi:hypothetical protein
MGNLLHSEDTAYVCEMKATGATVGMTRQPHSRMSPFELGTTPGLHKKCRRKQMIKEGRIAPGQTCALARAAEA